MWRAVSALASLNSSKGYRICGRIFLASDRSNEMRSHTKAAAFTNASKLKSPILSCNLLSCERILLDGQMAINILANPQMPMNGDEFD